MKKELAGIFWIVRRPAVTWLPAVMDPFRMLLGFLPRLRDALGRLPGVRFDPLTVIGMAVTERPG